MRYFMIDRVTELTVGRHAEAVKNITLSEDVLADHFPGFPVFPGALIIEAMAQLGGFLLEMSLNRPGTIQRALLIQVDGVKFHRPVEPGDQLVLRTEMGQMLEDAAKIVCLADVQGNRVARGTLTFVMKELDEEPLIHAQRKECYRIWTRHLPGKIEIL